jgi:phage terminase large subunit-like protein
LPDLPVAIEGKCLFGQPGNLWAPTRASSDVKRGRLGPAERNRVMRETTQADAALWAPYAAWVEQEPGSGGKESALRTIAELAGYDVHAETVTGSEVARANPFAAQCEEGNVKLAGGSWNAARLDEPHAFPGALMVTK